MRWGCSPVICGVEILYGMICSDLPYKDADKVERFRTQHRNNWRNNITLNKDTLISNCIPGSLPRSLGVRVTPRRGRSWRGWRGRSPASTGSSPARCCPWTRPASPHAVSLYGRHLVDPLENLDSWWQLQNLLSMYNTKLLQQMSGNDDIIAHLCKIILQCFIMWVGGEGVKDIKFVRKHVDDDILIYQHIKMYFSQDPASKCDDSENCDSQWFTVTGGEEGPPRCGLWTILWNRLPNQLWNLFIPSSSYLCRDYVHIKQTRGGVEGGENLYIFSQ